MILKALALTVTESDINTALETALSRMADSPQGGEALKKVKNPHVVLKKGLLSFKCKASMGFLPVPVEAQLRLEPAQDGAALNVTLAKVSLAMMGGEAVAGQLMGQLAGAVAGRPGLSVSGNTLTVDVKALAATRGIVLAGRIRAISLDDGSLALDFAE